MGLLDMLFKKPQNPLDDQTVKKYFEIMYGMRCTFLFSRAINEGDTSLAKNYVKYFLGETCDEEKLKKAIELCNISCKDNPCNETETILCDYRKTLRETMPYCLDFYDALQKFYHEDIDATTIKFNEVLDVIKDNVNYKHFAQGMSQFRVPHSGIKQLVFANSFYSDNPITKELMVEYFLDLFTNHTQKATYEDPRDIVVAIVLHALHFEKYGENKDAYPEIGQEDYRNIILSIAPYKICIDENPFKKEEYIEHFVKRIKKIELFSCYHSSYQDFCVGSVSEHFSDAACNLVWKKVAHDRNWLNQNGESISDSTDANDIFNIFCTCFEV